MTNPLTQNAHVPQYGEGRVYWTQLRLPSQEDEEEEEPLFAE